LLIGIPIGISLLLRPETSIDNSIETIVLQPNINPYTEKYNTNDQGISKDLIDLTQPLLNDNPQLLIAPETVFAEGTKITSYAYSEARRFSKVLLDKNDQLNLILEFLCINC